jgi:hypothetical protein
VKVAVLGESPADETILLRLVEAILAEPIEPATRPRLGARGWPSVLNILPAVYAGLYYHTDVGALVVVADADDSPIHAPSPWTAPCGVPRCRQCELYQAIGRTRRRLTPSSNRELRIAVAVAVPAVEAWLLPGHRFGSEAAVRVAAERTTISSIKHALKRDAYGTDRVTRALEERAAQLAEIAATRVAVLEQSFPSGFGSFARDVRAWKEARL